MNQADHTHDGPAVAEDLLSSWADENLEHSQEAGVWTVSCDHDHVSYEGKSGTLLHALLEARVDHLICNTYCWGDTDRPALTQTEINAMRAQVFRDEIGEKAEGEYHGGYHNRPART